jgi:Ca2+-binding RTX toxin-like protein
MMSGTGWNRQSYVTGETPDFQFSVLNNGNAAAGSFTVRAYLSVDSVVNAGDILIGERFVSSLAAGASSQTFTADIPIPVDALTGNYHYLVVYDSANQVTESNEANNSFWSGGGFWNPITLQSTALFGSAGSDRIAGTSNADEISGNGGDDIIKALDGNDRVDGGTGNDKIIAGGGADTLTGGSGNDVFKYKAASDSGIGVAADRITDFVIGSDRLNFSKIDANAGLAGDQAFAFAGTGTFSGGGVGSIRYQNSGTDLLVQIDVDGNGSADMEIILEGLSGQTLIGSSFTFGSFPDEPKTRDVTPDVLDVLDIKESEAVIVPFGFVESAAFETQRGEIYNNGRC